MSTKTMKILITVATLMLVVSLGSSTVLAAFDPKDLTGTPPTGTEIKDIGNKIIGILQAVGIVLSVVILTVLGIKYMMGSAEEKAEYKKTMIPYIIGAVCIFMAPQIASMVYGFVKSN